MAEFVLHVPDIDASGKDFRFAVSSAWLGGVLADAALRPAGDDGSLELHAQRQGADILVHGRLRAHVVAECVRCLGDAPFDVDTTVASLFTARGPALRPEPDEAELTPEELEREFYTGNDIVLDSLVREQVILEIPMQPLCDAACEGIQVPEHVRPPEPDAQSTDDAVDPRLAPLKELARQLSPDEDK